MKGSSTSTRSTQPWFSAQSWTHGELGDSQHSSRQSIEHCAGLVFVPWLSHTMPPPPASAAAHVALTHASQLCCVVRYAVSQQPSHTLHGASSPAPTQRCGASHSARTQASHSVAVKSAQQASHGAAQKPVAGAAHATAPAEP